MPVISPEGLLADTPYHFIDAAQIDSQASSLAVVCPADQIPDVLLDALPRVDIIKIEFINSGDGRGFSIARSLRQHGYHKTLRASGDLISDQFTFAIDCGFDEVEISEERLQRQPFRHWLYDPLPDYRAKLSA
ncbi:MAG: DUF934 domain-containing protein [Pseudomonadota bacterium]